MRFLVDQNLPIRLVGVLTGLGHEADHVKSLGLATGDDMEVWRRASDLSAVVVSKDKDFLTLAQRDLDGPGFVYLNVGNCSNEMLYDIVRRDWSTVIAHLTETTFVVELRP